MGNVKIKKKRRNANPMAATTGKEDLRFLKEGDRVKYQFRGLLNTEPENGIVQFVGYTEAKGELVAGIKFDNYIYRYGNTGCFNGVTLFKCQYGHGVFLPVKDILEQNPEFQQIREVQFLKVGVKIKYRIPDALHLNPEVGKIRYIGCPVTAGELMAGVEFDNYVGQGPYGKACIMHDVTLFECRKYGALISIKAILDENPEFQISAEDFPQFSVNSKKNSIPNQNLNPEVNTGRHETDDTNMSKSIAELQNALSVQKLEESFDMTSPSGHPRIIFFTPEILKVGCNVLFMFNENEEPVTGVVLWVGELDGIPHAGIEFEEPIGYYPLRPNSEELFPCRKGYGILRPIQKLMSNKNLKILGCGVQDFSIRSLKQGFDLFSRPEFICPPICVEDFMNYKGDKGIQGRTNSCYLDSTLFSMFAFTEIFDFCILSGNKSSNTHSKNEVERMADHVQILLGKYIVNPLRSEYFCPAEAILKLRELMLPLNSKLEYSFMDAEEFMFLLFEKVFNLDGFLTYDNGQSDFLHQIDISDFKSQSRVMSTQRLLEISMKSFGLKFMTVPNPALIIQMPRSGGKLVGALDVIIPTLTLDLTYLIRGGSRKCWICNRVATLECLDCFDTTTESGMKSTSYCQKCSILSHLHPERSDHVNVRNLGGQTVQEVTVDLVAVICVSSNHFVSFTRTGSGAWVFFDSNPTGKFPITEVMPKFDEWLKRVSLMTEADLSRKWESLNINMKRILTDSHICIYSPRMLAEPTTFDFETSL